MAAKNEELEAVLAELSKFGLKGRTEQLAKHLRVEWALPSGVTQHVTVAISGSDWRAMVQQRTRVRRMLREAGILEPIKPARTLERALSLPEPVKDQSERIASLEKDVAELMAWCLELSEATKSSTHALSQAPQPAVPPAVLDLQNLSFVGTIVLKPQVGSATLSAAIPVVPKSRIAPLGQLSVKAQVFNALTSSWKSRAELLKVVACAPGPLGSALDALKKAGKVESGQRGYWRRTVQARAEGVGTAVVVESGGPTHC